MNRRHIWNSGIQQQVGYICEDMTAMEVFQKPYQSLVTCVFLTILVSWVDSNPVHHIKFSENRPEASCVYNNMTYPPGSHFQPDPCTFCHCTKHGGRPNCAIEDCKYEPSCVHYEKSPESLCCQICVELGCAGDGGHVYLPGEVVSRTPCKTCICPDGGGRVECTQTACPDIMCVNPVKEKGDCCYRCPHGPNCRLGKRIIPAGKVVRKHGCKLCHCPTQALPMWALTGGPRAVCSMGDCT